MPTEAAITAGTASSGTAAAVGTAVKAFVLAHPATLSVTGGILLGVGAYYAINNWWGKRKGRETTAKATPAAS